MDEYNEARQFVTAALKSRRKYMDLSLQEFYRTTAVMLDDELPPSSHFCVPDKSGVFSTSAGDIISSEFKSLSLMNLV